MAFQRPTSYKTPEAEMSQLQLRGPGYTLLTYLFKILEKQKNRPKISKNSMSAFLLKTVKINTEFSSLLP